MNTTMRIPNHEAPRSRAAEWAARMGVALLFVAMVLTSGCGTSTDLEGCTSDEDCQLGLVCMDERCAAAVDMLDDGIV